MSDPGLTIKRRVPPEEGIPEYVLDSTSQFLLYVDDHVISGIREYCGRDTHEELGGILLGKHFQTGDRHAVEIKDFAPLTSQDRGAGHFTFDEHALQQAWRLNLPEGFQRIGWFHSHPRLGDPFMSTMDVKLHKSYFPHPWNISCVVTTGEWALPLGFWRITDQLVSVGSFYARMQATHPIGDQSRRFLGASLGIQVELETAFNRLKAALADAAEDVDPKSLSHLGEILQRQMPEGLRLSSEFGVGVLLEMAQCIAEYADSEALQKAAHAIRRLRYTEDFTTSSLKSLHLAGTAIAVSGEWCAAATLGERGICLGSFERNFVWPMDLGSSSRVIGVGLSADQEVVLALENNDVYLFPKLDIEAAVFQVSELIGNVRKLDLEPSEIVCQVVLQRDDLLVRSTEKVQRYALSDLRYGSVAPTNFLRHAHHEAGGLTLVEGLSSGIVSLLRWRESSLTALSGDGEELVTARTDWARGDLAIRSIAAAANTNAGLAILIKAKRGSYLAILEAQSLDLKYRYVSRLVGIEGITSDRSGALYIKTGSAVARLP